MRSGGKYTQSPEGPMGAFTSVRQVQSSSHGSELAVIITQLHQLSAELWPCYLAPTLSNALASHCSVEEWTFKTGPHPTTSYFSPCSETIRVSLKYKKLHKARKQKKSKMRNSSSDRHFPCLWYALRDEKLLWGGKKKLCLRHTNPYIKAGN